MKTVSKKLRSIDWKSPKAVRVMKGSFMALATVLTVLAYSGVAFASNGVDLSSVTNPVIGLINSIVNVALPLVGAGGALYCIILGVKYATAEEPQEREKRKQAIKTAIIGYVLIFVLMVVLKLSMNPLQTWMSNSVSGTTSTTTTTTQSAQ